MPVQRASLPGEPEPGRGRDAAAKVPVSGPEKSGGQEKHYPAVQRGVRHSGGHDGPRIPGDHDAHSDGLLAGGSPGLSGARPEASGEILRPASGAPAVQAAAHGLRIRPVLPDRALLPGRGCPWGPFAGRVLPAGHGNELRHPGRRIRGNRGRVPAHFCQVWPV